MNERLAGKRKGKEKGEIRKRGGGYVRLGRGERKGKGQTRSGAKSKKSEPVQGVGWRKRKQVIQAGSYQTPAWQRCRVYIGEYIIFICTLVRSDG